MGLPSAKSQRLPPCLAGFEAIQRFYDSDGVTVVARVLPGEFYVTTRDEMCITTLGSCVSACIRDPRTGVGGLNHFMLPLSDGSGIWMQDDPGAATRYGNFAMERLINELLKRGARRGDLDVKLAGGGRMYTSKADIGQRNIEFVRSYLAAEGLTISSEDLGDAQPRQIRYFPKTGRLQVRRLPTLEAQVLSAAEARYQASLVEESATGDIELF